MPAYPRSMKMFVLLAMKSIKAVRADCCSDVSVMIISFQSIDLRKNSSIPAFLLSMDVSCV